MADESGFADRMNGIPKYLVSTTLDKGEWNNTTVIRENVAEEVAKLKQLPGLDILVAGSGQLVRTLMEHDLIDEYQFMVHPIILGGGKRLFPEEVETGTNVLRLVGTKTFGSGIVVLTYEPEKK